jgi:AraC-like DNA-binding protein
MGFIYEERLSDSPYVETVTHGWTVNHGSVIRPAESHWHMVVSRYQGKVQFFIVGPLTTAGVVPFTEGAEILWIKLTMGTFMPHRPVRDYVDLETVLPNAACNSFLLHGSTWEYPNFENTETFISRLARQGVLERDPVVVAELHGHTHEVASRTVRHRFLRATGLSQGNIFQIERARQAATLLERGTSILDTAYEAGYFDQSHLTRALKQWVGHTPAQIIRGRQSAS